MSTQDVIVVVVQHAPVPLWFKIMTTVWIGALNAAAVVLLIKVWRL